VFESVDPAGQPWLNWNRETTYVRRESPDAGVFESWLEVTRVDGDLVSTRRTACWTSLRLGLALAGNLGESRRLSARLCNSMSDYERLAGAL
jgi:hypothetical protein